MVIFLTGFPFSSRKRTQKSLIPGPLITAPLIIFFPLLSVKRLETQSSITMRRSPERITASFPFSHHMDAELEPTAILTLLISAGLLTTVTAQNRTPYSCLRKPVAKRNNFTLKRLLSAACQVSSCSPTFTFSPSFGTTVNWLGKYSVANAFLI